MNLSCHEETERRFGCQSVQLLLQLNEPCWSQVNVLEKNPASCLGSSDDRFLCKLESFIRSHCQRLVWLAHLCSQVINLGRSTVSWSGAQDDWFVGITFFLQMRFSKLSFTSTT